MTSLLIISAVVFISYVVGIVLKWGILPSISDSYYKLRKYNPLFPLALMGFAIPAMLAGNTALMFLAGSGIIFCGTAGAFKEHLTSRIHFSGALIGIASGLASLWIDFSLWYFIPAMIISSFIIWKNAKNYIWWVEILSFTLIILGLWLGLSQHQ